MSPVNELPVSGNTRALLTYRPTIPTATLFLGGLAFHCRERIAHYKAPRSIDLADSLPRNASGNLVKRVLRAPYWAGRDR